MGWTKPNLFLAVHNSSIGDLFTDWLTDSVTEWLSHWLTEDFTNWHSKRVPRDLWPLRHLFRVMRRHDMTKKNDKDKYKDKDILRTPQSNPRNLWHLRHWLQFWQLRTWIHDNLCDLTINCHTGQHSQFLRCFFAGIFQLWVVTVSLFSIITTQLKVISSNLSLGGFGNPDMYIVHIVVACTLYKKGTLKAASVGSKSSQLYCEDPKVRSRKGTESGLMGSSRDSSCFPLLRHNRLSTEYELISS